MELIGQRFGHIRVTEVVGQGGMGDVYAGYDEKLERKVAVKVLNADQRLDLEAKERLLREARALSRLDHPNICRIHDYIESGDVDLLVLEYIDGKTLGELMTDDLSRGERLRIAIAIAGVLVAAHRAGIVHRDLKPENVMLTQSGEVKVLDFGLARWLLQRRRGGSSGGHKTVVLGLVGTRGGDTMPLPNFERTPIATAAGITLGTPLYMSPEQARGEELTTASDMFSFGLLLQALFTGNDPHPMGLGAREVILRVARGETNPVAGVPGDITTLVNRMKSFAAADRPTAVEAVERLQFLIDKPTRIFRRATAAVVAALISIAVWRYTVDLKRERTEAQYRRAQADDFIEFLLGDLRKKLEPVGRLDILDSAAERALQYVDSLHPETMRADELVRNAKALNQLGEVRILQGKPTEALQIFRRSVRLATAATEADPKDKRARMMLGTTHFWVGEVDRQQDRLPDALREYSQYLNIADSLAAQDPANEEYRLERAYGHSVVAVIYERQGEYARALDHLRLTREVKESLLAAAPADPERQADLAKTLNRIGFVLEREGKLRGAREHYERELAMYSRLAAADPKNSNWQDRLVTSHNFIARAFEMTGDLEAALAHRRAEVATIAALYERDAANAKWQRNLAISRMNYGSTLRMSGHVSEAFAEIDAAGRMLDQLLGRKEIMSGWQRDRASIHAAMGRVQLARGDALGAEQSARSSLELLTSAKGDAKVVQMQGAGYLALGDAQSARRHLADARVSWKKAADLLRPMAGQTGSPAVLDAFAQALDRLGENEEAQHVVQRLTAIGYRAPDFVSAMTVPKGGERS